MPRPRTNEFAWTILSSKSRRGPAARLHNNEKHLSIMRFLLLRANLISHRLLGHLKVAIIREENKEVLLARYAPVNFFRGFFFPRLFRRNFFPLNVNNM